MKIFVSYANSAFKKQLKFSVFMANLVGGFDKLYVFNENDIDSNFYKKNRKILRAKKGAGYWLWKPHILSKCLGLVEYDDYVFYCDAGAFVRKNINVLIKELDKTKQPIMGFELPLLEFQWTKNKLFKNMGCTDSIYKKSNHILASFFLVKKTNESVQFFKDFLNYAIVEENISDANKNSLDESEGFLEHRHDQSIFSLLYKKYGYRPFKDPSQYGVFPKGYAGAGKDQRIMNIKKYSENYRDVVLHFRKSNPLITLIKYELKKILNH